MARIVRIHGDAAVYPASACVSCLRPAAVQVEIVKIKGQAVRKVRVPFCDECSALRRHKSARQVLFERVATVNSLLLALAVGLYAFVRLVPAVGEAAVAWAVLLGALSALVVFGVMYLLVKPWSRRFRSPAAVAALQAATISDFDWETTVLVFRSDEYAEQFARANGAQSQVV
jgi:hypothetical protein